MDKLFCFLLAGGEGTRLKPLTAKESKAMVNICSSFHLIDFALSNCYLSHIKNLGVITQYSPETLIDYLIDWKSLINSNIRILPPKSNAEYHNVKYYDTAHSVYVNRDLIENEDYEDILVVHCDHVYHADYRKLYKSHLETNADLTIGVYEVPIEEASRFGILTVDDNGRVIDFEEKPENPKSNLISMGIYIYKKELMLEVLEMFNELKNEDISFSKDIVPDFVKNYNVNTVKFDKYWKDVGTIEALWEIHMNALDEGKNYFEIFNYRNTKILTKKIELQPSVMTSATFKQSFCGFNNKINGTIDHSVLGNNIIIEEGAHIINSVIYDSCLIKKGVTIKNAMVSKGNVIEKDFGNDDEISSI